ncbi:MAG: sulfatase-like hydrolase/transferase [Planctomycetes bacterium]|nr:sulfatase-like hydrolase/transferase [Planctomycetota bacterium]
MAGQTHRHPTYRRLEIIAVAGLAATLALQVFGQSAPQAGRGPNILVIMSDEHNASVMGCAGNKIARTPNLDRLAARGVLFNTCYTTSPLCVPARMSFTFGKYISRINVWNNSVKLPPDNTPSLPRILNAAGYESFLCGKMHYDSDLRYGFTELGKASTNRGTKNGRVARRAPDNLGSPRRLSERFADCHPGDKSGPLDHDRTVTELTTRFLAGRKGSDKPFFLLVGYLTPHFPIIVPEKYWEPYKGKVPMPTIPPGYLDSLPLNYRHLRAAFSVVDVPDDTVRRTRELYYGLVEWMDEQVGQVLKTLTDAGLAENTMIIYTADHGENMGEHGMWWKSCMFDSAARIPLIISYPRRWPGGQKRDGACSLVDVVQTIAEIGGAQVPADWDGRSMVPYLRTSDVLWKDEAVSEYYAHHIASGYVMLRAGRCKYVYHTPPDDKHPAQRELYDLEADPGELHNLANDPANGYLVEEMHSMLLKELGEHPDKTELRARATNQSAPAETDRVRPNRERKRS